MKPITLRQQLRTQLETEIRKDYSAGQLLPGERRLAERFGVSVVTVREALQGLVETGLIERRQGTGTIVVDARRRNLKLPVGILVEIDVTHPDTSPHYFIMAVQLKRALESRGHRAQLFFGTLRPGEVVADPTSSELLDAYRERSIKALIVLSWTTPAWRIAFESVGIPVLRFGTDCPNGVRYDAGALTLHAVRDFLEAGRSRIGLLTWGGESQNYFIQTKLFEIHLRENGLDFNPNRIFTEAAPGMVGAGWEGMREIWQRAEDRPDALIIADDVLLRGALLAIRELQIKVPEELMICSVTALSERIYPTNVPMIEYEVPIPEVIPLLMEITEECLQASPPVNRLVTLDIRRRTPRAAVRSAGAPVVGRVVNQP